MMVPIIKLKGSIQIALIVMLGKNSIIPAFLAAFLLWMNSSQHSLYFMVSASSNIIKGNAWNKRRETGVAHTSQL